MERVKLFGVDCFRIPNDPAFCLDKVVMYKYDKEPKEIAHWLKVSKRWQLVTREKIASCSVKMGELVLMGGYLYGLKDSLLKVEKGKGHEEKYHYLIEATLDLVRLNVMNQEQGRTYLLRYTTPDAAERMLASV